MKNASGILQGNLHLATCCHSRSCGLAECESNPSECTTTISTMSRVKRFKATIVSATIWLTCFVFYIATMPSGNYATTPESAKNIGGFMSECSGGVFHYDLGYRCDGYGPSKIASIIVLIGMFLICLSKRSPLIPEWFIFQIGDMYYEAGTFI